MMKVLYDHITVSGGQNSSAQAVTSIKPSSPSPSSVSIISPTKLNTAMPNSTISTNTSKSVLIEKDE